MLIAGSLDLRIFQDWVAKLQLETVHKNKLSPKNYDLLVFVTPASLNT